VTSRRRREPIVLTELATRLEIHVNVVKLYSATAALANSGP
jgi:hypothetical protein